MPYVGMVDTGAQINLISVKMLKLWKYEESICPVEGVVSVNNVRSSIDKWIKCDIVLLTTSATGIPISTYFAASSFCQDRMIILGLPFLLSCGAVLNLDALRFTHQGGRHSPPC